MEDMKTFGAVEMVLGLIDISLGSVLVKVETLFKKQIFAVFITGVWTIVTGLLLVCGGKKPSYCCMKYNSLFHICTLIFSCVAFGVMVTHIPYDDQRYCTSSSCPSIHRETSVLVSGILAVLITVFLVQALISLTVMLCGCWSLLCKDDEQSEVPECIGSTTSEPLCLPNQQQVTPGGQAWTVN